MDVISQSAYLLRVKRLRHNNGYLLSITLVDIHSGNEITLGGSDVPAMLRELIEPLDLAQYCDLSGPAPAKVWRCQGAGPHAQPCPHRRRGEVAREPVSTERPGSSSKPGVCPRKRLT